MRRAFSLVELLVVLSIVLLLMGIGMRSMKRDEKDAQVRGAAEGLAAVLRQTRSRAMSEQAAFGVVFNIQNQPGTSGLVLNNWSGGHWYRVIGPHQLGGNLNSRALIAPVWNLRDDANRHFQPNFPDYIANIADSWVSEPVRLPARQVRFLALADIDEGPRRTQAPRFNNSPGPIDIYYGDGGERTYPRPWFGWFDPAAKKWWPWGGYQQAVKYSGFYYEGSGGPIGDSRNPDSRVFNNSFRRAELLDGVFQDVDMNGDGDVDDLREREVGFALWRIGEPRPLVNADWMDACIVFNPLGQATFLEWNQGRRTYEPVQSTAPTPGDENWPQFRKNGCNDRAKNCSDQSLVDQGGQGKQYTISRWDYLQEDCNAEVVHFEGHNAGYHITLGPDAVVDGNDFPDARAVLDAITPAYRVYVGSSGAVQVMRVQRRQDAYLDGHAVWPANPSDWLQTSAGNPVFRRCRLGWLHQDKATTGYALQRTGKPINYIVTERMLADRIWWFDE